MSVGWAISCASSKILVTIKLFHLCIILSIFAFLSLHPYIINTISCCTRSAQFFISTSPVHTCRPPMSLHLVLHLPDDSHWGYLWCHPLPGLFHVVLGTYICGKSILSKAMWLPVPGEAISHVAGTLRSCFPFARQQCRSSLTIGLRLLQVSTLQKHTIPAAWWAQWPSTVTLEKTKGKHWL